MINLGLAIIGDFRWLRSWATVTQSLHALAKSPLFFQAFDRDAVLRKCHGCNLAED